MTSASDKLLIGAHTSAAGGVFNALREGVGIGATTIQLFTANQRQWAPKQPSHEDIETWHRDLSESGLQQVMSHAGYLINLGSPEPVNLEKSRKAFREEIQRCSALQITYLNFHPGSYLKSDPQECMDRIIESVLECQDLINDHSPRLLFESTAGQGSNLGHSFEQLGYLVQGVKDKLPCGVCIDTCHSFAAGYDIRTVEGWERTLEDFDRHVGLEHLFAFHLNDSMKELGSRRDRHQTLGDGEIGIECFRFLMQDPRTRDLPKYLETPGGGDVWKKEIPMLRGFATEG